MVPGVKPSTFVLVLVACHNKWDGVKNRPIKEAFNFGFAVRDPRTCVFKFWEIIRKTNCTIRVAGLSIRSRSGSHTVRWLMH